MSIGEIKRYAIVRNADAREHVESYMPSNYEVIGERVDPDQRKAVKVDYVIAGRDVAGWTLDDYVIPRCASGLLWVEEIDLSHPVMRSIPL